MNPTRTHWVEGSVPTALSMYYAALLRYMNPARTHWVEGSVPTFAVLLLHILKMRCACTCNQTRLIIVRFSSLSKSKAY